MRDPFLIIRLVFFVTLFYMNAIALGVAIWAIRAMTKSGSHVVGPPIFIIANACSLAFFQAVALADYWVPGAKTGQVKFECGWTFVLNVLQFVAAADVTVNGPPMYCGTEHWLTVCRAYILLTALAWASSIIFVIYFLLLLFTTAAHNRDYPAVWTVPIRKVPWFVEPKLSATFEQRLPKIVISKEPYENPVFHAYEPDEERVVERELAAADHGRIYEVPLTPPLPPFNTRRETDSDRESSRSSQSALRIPPSPVNHHESFRPMWAKKIMTRRGIDLPFVPAPNIRDDVSPITEVPKAYKPQSAAPAPPFPGKTSLLPPSGLNGGYLGIPAHQHHMSYTHFPMNVDDPDQPIQNSSPVSEWVRADDYRAGV